MAVALPRLCSVISFQWSVGLHDTAEGGGGRWKRGDA